MPAEPLFSLTADLRALGGGRVWSLMLSLFGDLVQGEGDVIVGPVLSTIMAELAVRPEAARVALHRLRNDGWITSEKNGRISHHGLSAQGRAKSRAASPRIYALAQAEGVQMVVCDPSEASSAEGMRTAGFTEVQPNVFVGSARLTAPKGNAVFEAREIPDWMNAVAIPSSLIQAYDKLARALDVLQNDLPPAAQLEPREIAALRCLVVHNWRRLVLKHPTPPAELVADDSGYGRCQRAVADLLARYPRPDLDTIT